MFIITPTEIRGSGYRATATTIADTEHRMQLEFAHLAGLGIVAFGLALATAGGLISFWTASIVAVLTAVGGVFVASQMAGLAATRAEAADRLIELDAFSAGSSDPAVARAVGRRRSYLVAARNRLALASAVRRDAHITRTLVVPPPAARVLAACPDLAEKIADELECDQADERLVIEVNRLLSAGVPDWDRLDRIERLIAS